MEDGAYCVIFMCAINVLYILCNKYMLCYVMLCYVMLRTRRRY